MAISTQTPPEPPLDESAGRRFAAGLTLWPLGVAFWAAIAAATQWVFSGMPPDWFYNLNPAFVVACVVLVLPVVLVGYVTAVYQRRWGRRKTRAEVA